MVVILPPVFIFEAPMLVLREQRALKEKHINFYELWYQFSHRQETCKIYKSVVPKHPVHFKWKQRAIPVSDTFLKAHDKMLQKIPA